MKILFMGTPDFSDTILKALIASENEVAAVFTGEDKKRGRGMATVPTAVKLTAEAAGIPVYTPKTLKDFAVIDILKSVSPEMIIVAAYGKILPEYVLDFPKYGCVNVHASLLPRWRGAAPIQRAMIAGDNQSGVCIMKMEAGIDTGPVYTSEATNIDYRYDNGGTLHDRLADIGARLLISTIPQIAAGLTPLPQADNDAIYASMLTKEDRLIDWSLTGCEIVCRIKALSPAPCACASLDGKNLKLFDAEYIQSDAQHEFGKIILGDSFDVSCKDGCVRITALAPEGKKLMDGADFIKGRKNCTETILK